MRATAKHYGLTVNYWVDERRDPIKSTVAASRYLRDLHNQFGDWYLALAAYNAGPRKVSNAIKATKSRDYWTLAKSPYLKSETKNYIPKLLAALIIATHREHYGFEVAEDIRNSTPTTNIFLTHSHRLEDLSQALGLPLSELKRWNPELLKAVTPPTARLKEKAYALRIPSPLLQKLSEVREKVPKLSLREIDYHRIHPGETLSDLALKYRTTVGQIMQDNPSLNPFRLKPGQLIVVPAYQQRLRVSAKN
jgi:membrane-bound lytic murein transglycosylase D